MLIIFLWILFSIVVGVYADSKKTSPAGIGIFFISLVLTPIIGLFIVLALKPDESKILRSGEMKKCPKCAELIKTEAKKCRYCGFDL